MSRPRQTAAPLPVLTVRITPEQLAMLDAAVALERGAGHVEATRSSVTRRCISGWLGADQEGR